MAVLISRSAARSAGFVSAIAIAISCANSDASSPSVVVDNFERSELGANWQVAPRSVTGIVSGDLGALSYGPMGATWIASQFPANQFSELTIAAGKDSNMLVQVFVRRQARTGARYGFHYNAEQMPAVWEIKYDGVRHDETRVLASTPGPAPVAGDIIRVEAREREISGSLNGQRLLVAADNAPNAILMTGTPGLLGRPKRDATVAYPAPVVATWRGGSLLASSKEPPT